MKAHGITGNTGGGGKAPSAAGSGPSTPKTPKTPANRKALPDGRPSSGKKRKLAASSDDVDDIKNEVKDEVKQEDDTGSYTKHPTDPQFDAAMENFVKSCGETFGFENCGVENEVLVVAKTRQDHGEMTAAPVEVPIAMAPQMFLPYSPETFYGFFNQHTSCLQQQSLSQPAIAITSAPLHHDHDTDCLPQTRMPSEHSTAQWLHQQRIYWNGEPQTQIGGNLEWDH